MYYSVLWARVIRRRLGSGLNHSGAKLQLSKLGQPRAPLITRALCARSPRSAELVHVYRLRRLQVSNRSNACRWAEALALSLPLLNISLKQNKKSRRWWKRGRRQRNPRCHLTLLLETAACVLAVRALATTVWHKMWERLKSTDRHLKMEAWVLDQAEDGNHSAETDGVKFTLACSMKQEAESLFLTPTPLCIAAMR